MFKLVDSEPQSAVIKVVGVGGGGGNAVEHMVRQEVTGVDVIMDQTVWLNYSMRVEAVEGEKIVVSGERALVEKGSTSKKITVSKEAIEALPVRDMADLFSLQSGVV